MPLRKLFAPLLAWIACAPAVYAQSTPAQAGYRFPELLEVAPGQVVMITVSGVETLTPASSFVSVPEAELGGLRASIQQDGRTSVTARMLGYRQHPCPATRPACTDRLTSITFLMPLELEPDLAASLVIDDRGRQMPPLPLRVLPDKIHILNSCDEVAVFVGLALEAEGACLPIVQGRGGRLITARNPARSGESVTAWAYGLGNPGPSPQPPLFEPVSVLNPPDLFFTFRANAAGARQTGRPGTRPSFAGTPGDGRLFQINFAIPEVPAGVTLPSCDGAQIASNLAVLFVGQTSSDTARICVQP